MSETILGVLIGGSFTLGGVIINIITNFLMERRRYKNDRLKTINQKKDEIYLKIYKLYYQFAHELTPDKQKTLLEIYEATLELKMYGSRKISAMVEKIDPKRPTFSQDIEQVLMDIRKELRVEK